MLLVAWKEEQLASSSIQIIDYRDVFFDNAYMNSIHRVMHQTHGSCSQPLHLAHWCAMFSAKTHMPVVQRSAGSHACSSVNSSVYLLPTACADSLTDDSVTANCHCQLSLATVTAN